jgi:hypothetical protein
VFTPTEVTGKLEKGRELCLNPLSGDETRFLEKLECSTGLGSQTHSYGERMKLVLHSL